MMKTHYNPFVYNPTAYNLTPRYTPRPSPQEPQYLEQSNLIRPIQTIPEQPHTVQPKPMELHAEPSNWACPMIQGFLVDSNTISPPLYDCTGVARSITCVDQMNAEQTGNWVYNLGKTKGWKEAETYGKSFKDNSITGMQLQELNSMMLKEQLGMSDNDHRMELLSTIKSLFPGYPIQGSNPVIPAPQPLVASTMGSLCESEYLASIQTQTTEYGIKNYLPSPICSVRRHGESDGESSYSHVSTYWMSESGNREQTAETAYSANVEGSGLTTTTIDNGLKMTTMSTGLGMTTMAARKSHEVRSFERDGSIRSTRRASYKKLILTLQPEQILQDDVSVIDRIRHRFREFYAGVTVKPVEGSDVRYLIAFETSEMAQDAFYRAGDIGYKLVKKWPARPNPNNPIKYRSTTELKIRAGKAFSGQVVGALAEGQIVTVNQLKGRRARLIKEVNGGEPEVIGWVSVHSQEGGKQFLVQESEL